MLAHSVDCRNLGLNRSNTATVIYSTVSTNWYETFTALVWIDLFNAVSSSERWCRGPISPDMACVCGGGGEVWRDCT